MPITGHTSRTNSVQWGEQNLCHHFLLSDMTWTKTGKCRLSYQTLLLRFQVGPWGLCWFSERMRWGSYWRRELCALRLIPPSWPPSSPGRCLYRAQTWTWGTGRSCAESWASSGLRGLWRTDLRSGHWARGWTSGGWAAAGEGALCFALCPSGRPSWLPLVPGRQMSSTCICPMAAQEQAGGQISAMASCNGASGTRPDRDPGLDSHSPQGGLYIHSWSSTHRLPPGSGSEQMEASKMAETAGLPAAVLQHGHTTLTSQFCSESDRRGLFRSGSSSCRRRVRADVSLFLNRLVTVFLRGSGASEEDKVSFKPGQSPFTSRLWFPPWTG